MDASARYIASHSGPGTRTASIYALPVGFAVIVMDGWTGARRPVSGDAGSIEEAHRLAADAVIDDLYCGRCECVHLSREELCSAATLRTQEARA